MTATRTGLLLLAHHAPAPPPSALQPRPGPPFYACPAPCAQPDRPPQPPLSAGAPPRRPQLRVLRLPAAAVAAGRAVRAAADARWRAGRRCVAVPRRSARRGRRRRAARYALALAAAAAALGHAAHARQDGGGGRVPGGGAAGRGARRAASARIRSWRVHAAAQGATHAAGHAAHRVNTAGRRPRTRPAAPESPRGCTRRTQCITPRAASTQTAALPSIGPYNKLINNTPRCTNSVKLIASGTVRLFRAPTYRFGFRFTLLSCSPCTHAALAAQAGSALCRHAPCPRRPACCCSCGRCRALCPRPARAWCSRAVLRHKGCATRCGATLMRVSCL